MYIDHFIEELPPLAHLIRLRLACRVRAVTRPLAGFTKLQRINLRESLLSLSLPMSSRARTSPPEARRADRETKWKNLRLATHTAAIEH